MEGATRNRILAAIAALLFRRDRSVEFGGWASGISILIERISRSSFGRSARVPRACTCALLVCFAIAPLGCKSPVGTTSTSMLRNIEESSDPNVRHLAYSKLASPRAYDDESQKVEAAKVLTAKLSKGEEPIASQVAIVRTLGELAQPESRDVILRVVEDRRGWDNPNVPDPTGIRRAACRALGRVARPEDATILARIMLTDPDLDTRIAAIEGLAAMKTADPRIDLVLVDGMEHTEPAIRLASLRALQTLSGQDLGPEPGPWKTYAEERMKHASPDQTGMATAPPVTVTR